MQLNNCVYSLCPWQQSNLSSERYFKRREERKERARKKGKTVKMVGLCGERYYMEKHKRVCSSIDT